MFGQSLRRLRLCNLGSTSLLTHDRAGGDRDDGGRGPSKHPKAESAWKSRRVQAVVVIITAVAVFLIVTGHFYDAGTGVHNRIFGASDDVANEKASGTSLRHAIMLDAGSTGSRVLVFTFRMTAKEGNMVLLDEFFKEVKPGISSYADNPGKAAESIKGLVEDAKKIVPVELWPLTTVSLKATAGLRLLPAEVADNLLNEIRDVFASSGFRVRSNAVTIIDGKSEGLYLWTTINFLLGKTSDLSQSMVVIDLGGASAQIAMIPLDPVTISDVLPEDVSTVSVFDQSVKFYIHSYLGMGLMAMRLSILRATNRTIDDQSTLFLCPYVSHLANFTWEFQGSKYNIRGLKKSGSAAGPVNELAEQIKQMGMQRVHELERRTLFAVSYFYDLAVDAGLIDASLGGSVSVGDFCRSARKACESASTDMPFACIDVTYICTLLRDGFALPEDKFINLKKKIDGHETSWALGAALVDLHNKQEL